MTSRPRASSLFMTTLSCFAGLGACGDSDGSGGGWGSNSATTTNPTIGSTTSATGGAGGEGTGGSEGGAGGGSGTAAPSGLTAVVDGALIDLSWTNPDPSSGNTVVKVLRTLNVAPAGPDDPTAAVVYQGSAEAADEPTSVLLPDMPDAARTYHYAAYGCTPSEVCETMGSATTLTISLTEALSGGGYNLFWRHASATVCSDNLALGTAATTTSPNWWKSCEADCALATTRQLNATGVMEAISIGQDLAALSIPFGRVLSSEYCRTRQTAEHMALGPTIEEVQELTYYVYDEANRCADSQALLAEVPAFGTNVALVSHAGFVCPVLDSLAWSEAAIYKPDGNGGSELVTRVLWDGWAALP